ncbi:ferredoxin [Tumidithrix helvetica PCC 7403]|uniref:ferredoxin n=1 Tax=Tumidithrix helvetica TaxID=3457545 RepID=UPI003CA257FC
MANPQTDIYTGFEPELGGDLRHEDADRSGFEPELGGALRQNAVYVDEGVCIGCGHCAHTARNTFFLEESYGRARVIAQDGDEEVIVQEAIDTCPVDCIAWVNYTDLAGLEAARKEQIIQNLGIIGDGSTLRARHRKSREIKSEGGFHSHS